MSSIFSAQGARAAGIISLSALLLGIPVLTRGAGAPTCLGQTATIYVDGGLIVGGDDDGDTYSGELDGGNGDDVIVGTSGADEIDGGNGADTICGADGDDEIKGGSQNDTLCGEGGNDIIEGENGEDTLCGGDGNDTLKGDNGIDSIDGGIGTDTLEGSNGPNTCYNGESMTGCDVQASGSFALCSGGSGTSSAASSVASSVTSSVAASSAPSSVAASSVTSSVIASSIASSNPSSASSAFSFSFSFPFSLPSFGSSESSASSASVTSSSSSALTSSSSSVSTSAASVSSGASSSDLSATSSSDASTGGGTGGGGSGGSQDVFTEGGNGSFRGKRTTQFRTMLEFITGFHTPSDLAAPAFGGGPRVPFSDAETKIICGMQLSIARTKTVAVDQWMSEVLSTMIDRPVSMIYDAINSPSFCEDFLSARSPRVAAEVASLGTPFYTDAEGYPVSTNKTWNACIKGEVTLELVRNNPDRHEDGYGEDCARYHTKNMWYHPDLAMYFEWKREEAFLALPKGFVAVKQYEVTSAQ